jgi:shikimate dehydrogenase
VFTNFIIGDDVEGKARSPLIWNTFYEKNAINEKLISKNVAPSEMIGVVKEFIANPLSKVLVIAKPYKSLIGEFIAREVSVNVSERGLSSVNLVYKEDGKVQLCSTDGFGFLKSLESDGFVLPEVTTVLGYGATSKSIIDEILRERISTTIEVYTRNPTPIISSAHKKIRFLPWSKLQGNLGNKTLIVNTTTVGNSSDLDSSILSQTDIASLIPSAQIRDVNYTIGAENQLARSCRAANIQYSDGLTMNFYQAVKALSLVYPLFSAQFDFSSILPKKLS